MMMMIRGIKSSLVKLILAQINFAFVGIDPSGQLFKIVSRQRGLANEGHGHIVDHAHVFKVAVHFERNIANQRRHGGHANVMQ